MIGRTAIRWALHGLRLARPATQVSAREREALRRHAAGRRSLVEIGVMQGASTALLRAVMDPEGEVAGIDPHPPGRTGVNFDRLIAAAEVARVRRGRARLVRASSAEAARTWSEPIDFLFIDADHSWDGVRADWEAWSGWVRPGGRVAFHDGRVVDGRLAFDSARFVDQRVRPDPRFRLIDEAETLVVFERLPDAASGAVEAAR